MEILGKIQAALSNKTKENEAYYLFLIDVFVLSVVVVSGLANTFSIANTVATSRPKRLDIFGEALHVLCQRDFWSENVIRVILASRLKFEDNQKMDFFFVFYRFTSFCITFT